MPYKDRLISLKLHTLKYRRLRGDMIEVVKIVNGIYDEKVAPTLHFSKTSVTRGNKFKLHNQTFTHNFKKHFFSARIVNIWNSLPNWVVDVQFIDLFKVRLDRFWAQQKVMYDWTAELAGTGDRSEYVKKWLDY